MKTPEQILTAIAQANNVTVDDIIGRSRERRVADARKMAMFTLVTYSRMTLHNVGAVLNKDHSTVLYARETHPDILANDRAYAAKYAEAMCIIRPTSEPERRLPRQIYAGKIVLQACRA